jgi:hypothetical protein
MIRCYTILRRVIPPIGGAWIPYTAAQVAARRAAQVVAVVVCVSVPGTAQAPRECNCAPPPIPIGPVMLIPRADPMPRLLPAPVPVSEPGSLAVLAVGLLALGWVRR